MSCMPSFTRIGELKIVLDRLNREVESVISNVRCVKGRGNSIVAYQESIEDIEQFLKSYPAARTELDLWANNLVKLNCDLEIALARRSDFYNGIIVSDNIASTSLEGSLDNATSSCVKCSKEKNTVGTNTDIVSGTVTSLNETKSICKLYDIEIESILEMQHLHGDTPSEFWLAYYSDSDLQCQLAEIKQKLLLGELQRFIARPAVGQFIIGCVDTVFRGYVLTVHCESIVALDIDTGMLKFPSVNDAWEIGNYLSELPPQAMRCKLWSVPDNVKWCNSLSRMFRRSLSKSNLVVIIKDVFCAAIPIFVVDVDAHDEDNLLDVNMSEWINDYVIPTVEKEKLFGQNEDSMFQDIDPYELCKKEDCSDSNSVSSKGSQKNFQKEASNSYDVLEQSTTNETVVTYTISDSVTDNKGEIQVRDSSELSFSSAYEYSGEIVENDISNSSFIVVENSQDLLIKSFDDLPLSENIVEQTCLKENDQLDTHLLASADVKCSLEKDRVVRMSFLKGDNPWDFILHYVPKQEIVELKKKLSKHAEAGRLVPLLKHLQVGDFVIGKLGNEYCRVRVIYVPDTEDVKVIDVDSGESKFISRRSMWLLEEAFSFPPALAVCCSLWNITRQPFYWNKDLQELFKKVLRAVPLSVKVKDVNEISGNWKHTVQIRVVGDFTFDVSEWIMLNIFPKLKEIRQFSDCGNSINDLNLDPATTFSMGSISRVASQQSKHSALTLNGSEPNSSVVLSCKLLDSKVQVPASLTGGVQRGDSILNLLRDDKMSKDGRFKFSSKSRYNDYVFDFKKPTYDVKPGKKYYAFMSNIVSPNELYVHIVTEENAEVMTSMHKELESYCSTSSIHYHNKSEAKQLILQCCAVYYSSQWCRSRIIDWLDNNTDNVLVFLVDYGVHTRVSFHSIQSLRSDFYEHPVVAQRCTLASILPSSVDGTWPQQSVDGLLTVLDYNTVYEIHIEKFLESEETLSVFLSFGEDKEVTSVNDYMIDEGLAVPCNQRVNNANGFEMSHSIECPILDNGMDEGFSDEEDLLDDKDWNRETIPYFDNNTAGLPQVGEEVSVVVTEVIDFASFYGVPSACQHEGRQFSTAELLKKMHTKIMSAVNGGKLKPPQGLLPGTIAVAQYSKDKKWYRARVVTHVDESGFVEVFFVDYGNIEPVHKQHIKSIRQDFTSLPFQAIRFLIDGIDSIELRDKNAQVKALGLLSTLEGKEVLVKVVRLVNEDIKVRVLCGSRDMGSEIIQLYHREGNN